MVRTLYFRPETVMDIPVISRYNESRWNPDGICDVKKYESSFCRGSGPGQKNNGE